MSNFIRSFKDTRYRLFYGCVLSKGHTLVTLGNRETECQWTFDPSGLNSSSVILSGGVGRDITFEHALLSRFGSNIVLFDPSPTGIETMSFPENRVPQFRFFPLGLAGKSGSLSLSAPMNPDEGSWFSAGGDGEIQVPCVDISTLLKQSGHDHIDLLKIDIEGAEYDVIDDILARRIRVRQILVEYHHGILPGYPRSRTIRSILKMLQHGYKLLHQEGNNHTFYNPKFRS